MKIKDLRYIIREAIREVEGDEELKKAPKDTDRLIQLAEKIINNKMEYEPALIAMLELDVPQKTAAINSAFSDRPDLKAVRVKHYGDEKDTSRTYDIKGTEPPEDPNAPEEEPGISDITIDDEGTIELPDEEIN